MVSYSTDTHYSTMTIILISLGILYHFLFRRSSNSLPIPSYAGPGSSAVSGLRGRMQDFTRFILRRDPWGDTHDDLGLPNGNGYAATPSGGPKKSWFPWRRSARHSRAGFSRLATSPEEESMMHREDDSDEDEQRANGNGHAGAYGDDGNLNSNAVWGETPRPGGIDGSGVIRL
jgi:hypothetical protein